MKILTEARTKTVVRPERALPSKQNPKRLSSAQNAAIAAAYKAGKSVIELAVEFNVTEGTIHHRLNVAGVERRSLSMTEEAIARAIALRAAGMPNYKISKEVGYAQATVAKELRLHGAW